MRSSAGCNRPGCKRGVRDGRTRCSYLCNTVADRIERAERMCRALGPGPTSTAMWVAVVELGDALTLEQNLETLMYREAMAKGYTEDQWAAVKAGS
ncbi:MAG: hypothetical protein JWR34_3921 [Mycobacterium sp.]|nr:hypothetical protein [Mycobacterium sp.]